jgi:hypothetical protein
MSHIPVFTDAPASRSPSPQSRGDVSPRSPAQAALGDDARVLVSHNQVPAPRPETLVRRRDRAIFDAARLTVFIKALKSPLEGESSSVRLVKVEQCAKWQERRDRWIHRAVILTREIDRPNLDVQGSVRRTVRRKMAELSVSEEFRKLAFGVASKPLDPVPSKASAETASAPEIVGKCAVPEVVEKTPDPEVAEKALDPETVEKVADLARPRVEDAPLDRSAFVKRLVDIAVKDKKYEILEQFVRKGTLDPRLATVFEDEQELSLLAHGIKHNLPDSYLRMLIDRGADVRVMVRSGAGFQGIVGVAIERNWDEAVIERLIRSGALIPPCIGEIPTLEFVYKGDQLKLFQLLIAGGAPTDIQIDGKTLIGKAIADNVELALKFVLGKVCMEDGAGNLVAGESWASKFRFNVKGSDGQNVLHDYCEATQHFNENVFFRLIELGAEPYEPNQKGETPVSMLHNKFKETGEQLTRQAKRELDSKIEKHMKKRSSKRI